MSNPDAEHWKLRYDRQCAELKESRERCAEQTRKVAALLSERDALRKDAERYRWLRKHYHPGTDILDAMRFGTLDAAIDKAMQGDQGK